MPCCPRPCPLKPCLAHGGRACGPGRPSSRHGTDADADDGGELAPASGAAVALPSRVFFTFQFFNGPRTTTPTLHLHTAYDAGGGVAASTTMRMSSGVAVPHVFLLSADAGDGRRTLHARERGSGSAGGGKEDETEDVSPGAITLELDPTEVR